jgi:hypothetical protein
MKRQSKSTIGPVEFIDRRHRGDEKSEPFSLASCQSRVLEMAIRRALSGIARSTNQRLRLAGFRLSKKMGNYKKMRRGTKRTGH